MLSWIRILTEKFSHRLKVQENVKCNLPDLIRYNNRVYCSYSNLEISEVV